ncbi:histidine kinase [Muricauda sp. 2012CJ35-5]|uniref:Histidine kinase n=1 Tax=Flagellimonas spongiicola TaxID=2942208 RepID=A0ABT0PRE2_9FLAO|nr:histidine kinase [Allomuricauda spongiicola]MCL6273771.1 histidine kinase [Allomuricauda spongiicola]
MIALDKKNSTDFFRSDIVIIVVLWITIILMTTFDKDNYHIHFHEFIITVNKLLMFIVVNYVIFPNFYLRQKLWFFILIVIGCIFFFGYVEEILIEPYLDFDPNTHGIAPPVSVFVGYATPLAIFLGIKFLFYFNKREHLINKLEKEKSESQLSFLKSQINPHVLFNNLNNIYSLALRNDSRAKDAILTLSKFLRYVIYDSTEKVVLLSREIENLESYLELQEIQLEGRGKITYINKSEPSGYTIAPLLLLPFVENCFKHSTNTLLSDIDIVIKIDIIDGVLNFYCSNPHEKFDTPNQESNGIGLVNTRQRLELMYQGDYKLDISSNQQLFEVWLKLNLL